MLMDGKKHKNLASQKSASEIKPIKSLSEKNADLFY